MEVNREGIYNILVMGDRQDKSALDYKNQCIEFFEENGKYHDV